MALLPSYILRQCFLRIGAYQGQAAAIETSYLLTDPATNSKSADFTKTAMLDGLVEIEQEMAGAVALGNDARRNVIADVTATVLPGALVPTVGTTSATAKVIGKYGQIRDAVSPFRPLTADLPVSEIRALSQNPGTMFKSDIFSYALEGRRLDHTRTGAIVDVCVFDFDARKTAISADGPLLFSDAENCYFSGLMSLLKNTDAILVELANQYAPRYQAWIAAMQAGGMPA